MKTKAAFQSVLSIVLAITFIFSGTITALAAEPSIKESSLEIQQWPTQMNTIDPETWYNSPLNGLYEVPITVGGAVRPFYMYVPADAYPNQPVVHILIDSAADVKEFLQTSGWQKISEDEVVILTIMTAKDGEWGVHAAEHDYIRQSYTFLTARPFVDVRRHNMYLAAYGDAADLGMEYALKKPEDFAGILSVGNTGLSANMGSELNTGLSIFYDGDGKQLKYSEIVYPAWIVSEEKTDAVSNLISYFKDSNRTESTATASDLADEYYAPNEALFPELEYEAVGGVYYSTGAAEEYMDYDFNLSVWLNMFECIRRYPSFGEVRSYIPSDEDPLFTRYDAMVYGGDLNGNQGTDYNRFWYVYQPQTIKDTDTDIPVVFVFHGNGGGPSEITDQTGWKMLAEELGAILVAPQGSASWGSSMSTASGVPYRSYTIGWTTSTSATRPNDLLFIDYLMNWMTKDSKYASMVDVSRVFMTGQSAGGQFTHNLVAYRPYYFAGAAPCSWVANPGSTADVSVDIPVINVMGQKDTTISGAFSGSSGRNIFNYYLDRYKITERGGLGRVYSDFNFMVVNPQNVTAKEGMLNEYIFDTEKGYPMFEAVEIPGMGHATVPTAVRHIWDMMFKHYTRDPATGILYYDGKVVDTAVNLALAAKAYPLSLTTKAHNVKAGDYFTMNTTFTEKQSSNAATLSYTFDGDKFEYANFTPADGVQVVNTEYEKGSAKITLISMNYDLENFGDIMLRAKENAELAKEFQTVSLAADYVVKDEAGSKEILTADASARFTTLGNGTIEPVEPGDTNDDGVVDLIDLSNMIDWFGTTSGDADWETLYTFFDFNNNGEIDINDISYVARLIK